VKFLSHVLRNGLEIVAECNEEAYSTALGFFVRAGARDETAAVAGVSHFLEHMLFKGTPSRSAEQVNREFDEMGAHYNAFTTEENTVYYAAVLPEHQDRAVALLGDLLRPSLRQEDFDTEKQVILEEIRMYEDQPPFGADDKCRAAFFGDHPLGHSVLGTAASVGALSVAEMRAYFQRRYSPHNITLAAAGRIDFDALVASAEAACGHWQRGDDARLVEPARPRPSFLTLSKASATQQYVLQLAQGPDARAADRYAAKLLAIVLGDDSGSRLYWELVDPGLAEHCELNHHEYEGAGIFVTFMSCAPEAAAENLRAIAGVYARAAAEGITPAELEQARSKVRSRLVLSSERPRGRLFSVGSDWLYRREYRPLEEELDTIAALGVDDAAAVLARYPLELSTTITIGPG
jgi:predicted Zn-dependent peptidase